MAKQLSDFLSGTSGMMTNPATIAELTAVLGLSPSQLSLIFNDAQKAADQSLLFILSSFSFSFSFFFLLILFYSLLVFSFFFFFISFWFILFITFDGQKDTTSADNAINEFYTIFERSALAAVVVLLCYLSFYCNIFTYLPLIAHKCDGVSFMVICIFALQTKGSFTTFLYSSSSSFLLFFFFFFFFSSFFSSSYTSLKTDFIAEEGKNGRDNKKQKQIFNGPRRDIRGPPGHAHGVFFFPFLASLHSSLLHSSIKSFL